MLIKRVTGPASLEPTSRAAQADLPSSGAGAGAGAKVAGPTYGEGPPDYVPKAVLFPGSHCGRRDTGQPPWHAHGTGLFDKWWPAAMGRSEDRGGSNPTESMRIEFGRELRRCRTDAGLSQAALARRISYHRAYVSQVELARECPSERFALACDKALGADGALVEILCGREDSAGTSRRYLRRAPAGRPGVVHQGIPTSLDEVFDLELSRSRILRLASDGMRLAEGLFDLNLTVEVDIGRDGWAVVRYGHEYLNVSDQPHGRVFRDLWFENTAGGPLPIEPIHTGRPKFMIIRHHDAAGMARFAVDFTPPIRPGKSAVARYVCDCGGRFIHNHFWQQAIRRHTLQASIVVRQHGAGSLVGCSASRYRRDGAEVSRTDGLEWQSYKGDIVVAVTRRYLRPDEILELRWKISPSLDPMLSTS